MSSVTRRVGRPEATSHADIEAAAFGLFAKHGFEHTTLDMIAAEVGVSRRTLFGYYASKNDIPWGQFDRSLERFHAVLEGMPATSRCGKLSIGACVRSTTFPPTRGRRTSSACV